jgi:hypothetical protein
LVVVAILGLLVLPALLVLLGRQAKLAQLDL